VNRRPPPSAATDCPRPSSIPILEQHSRLSFLPRPPLLYPAAARASFLSYRFQRPCRPEERAETEQNVAVLWINLSYVGSKRGTDRACRSTLECQSDPGSFATCFCRGWRNDGSIDTRRHQKTKSETAALFLSSSARRIFTSDKKYLTSSCIYVESFYFRESTFDFK